LADCFLIRISLEISSWNAEFRLTELNSGGNLPKRKSGKHRLKVCLEIIDFSRDFCVFKHNLQPLETTIPNFLLKSTLKCLVILSDLCEIS